MLSDPEVGRGAFPGCTGLPGPSSLLPHGFSVILPLPLAGEAPGLASSLTSWGSLSFWGCGGPMWGRAQGRCRRRAAPPSFVHVGGLEEWGGQGALPAASRLLSGLGVSLRRHSPGPGERKPWFVVTVSAWHRLQSACTQMPAGHAPAARSAPGTSLALAFSRASRKWSETALREHAQSSLLWRLLCDFSVCPPKSLGPAS